MEIPRPSKRLTSSRLSGVRLRSRTASAPCPRPARARIRTGGGARRGSLSQPRLADRGGRGGTPSGKRPGALRLHPRTSATGPARGPSPRRGSRTHPPGWRDPSARSRVPRPSAPPGCHGHQFAPVYESEAVAMLRLVHVVRREEDGGASTGKGVDEVPERPAADRVRPGRRLVEKEDRGSCRIAHPAPAVASIRQRGARCGFLGVGSPVIRSPTPSAPLPP